MLLDALLRDPLASLQYSERYVNDGSPSGFTHRFTTSPATSPFGQIPHFSLGSLEVADDCCESLGVLPDWLFPPVPSGRTSVLIHPDMRGHSQIQKHESVRYGQMSSYLVVPTSSGRTVQCDVPSRPDYIKLHYDNTLGRMNRKLTLACARSAVEVSTAIRSAIMTGAISERFGILPEDGARVASITTGAEMAEWGLVYRCHSPLMRRGVTVSTLVPAFALFSRDRNRPHDPLLIEQVIEASSSPAKQTLLEDLLFPIIESYFTLLITLGLQAECHAQNVLFGLNARGRITAVILRDLESVDKDVSLMKDLGLSVAYSDLQHKCLYRERYNYVIKHSFMFDFKCGRYLLDPIIRACAVTYSVNEQNVVDEIRDLVDHFVKQLPPGFYRETSGMDLRT